MAKEYRKIEKSAECPSCNWSGEKFLDFQCGYGRVYRDAECPECKSQPRHRLFYLYFNKILDRDKKLKLLHVSPEKILEKQFKSYKNIDYLSMDIDPEKAMIKEDLTNLSFRDNSFDILVCSHVLEHIPDDRRAMSEIRRVIKKSGFATLDVPINEKVYETHEDPNITSREGRTKAFLQWDHLRLYGTDFKDRLKDAGFIVSLNNFVDSFTEEEIHRYGLEKRVIYRCSK